jgi:hypothetical protein
MNKMIKKAVLASVGAVIAAQAAYAGNTYNQGDLMLSFFKSGTSQDLVFDLGSVSQFDGPLSAPFNLSTVGFDKTLLLNTFGGSLNNVIWTAWADVQDGITNPTWATRNSSTPWNNALLSSLSLSDQKINALGVLYAGVSATDLSGTAATVPNSNANSPTKLQGSAGKIGASFQGNTDLGSGISFVTTGYLSEVQDSGTVGTGPGSADGYFTFDAGTGDGTYTTVPEPCTINLLAGAGLLALAFRRQLTSTRA